MAECYLEGMRPPGKVNLFLRYHAFNAYGLNVLGGAVDAAREAGSFLPAEAEVIAVDGGAEDLARRLREAAAAGEASVVAWSFYTLEAPRSFAQIAEAKAAFSHPSILHLAGGVHASAEPEAVLRAGFDAAAIGEGEETLVALLRAMARGEDIRGLAGLAFLEGEGGAGKLRSNGPGARQELDRWPPFFERARKFNPIEITRGCIYACKFCQTPFLFKARFRHRSVENVAHWARRMRALRLPSVRFTTPTSLSYGSDDEGVRLDRIEALLSAVREAMGKEGKIFFGTFPSEVRPEHVSREALAVLKRYVDNDNLILGGQSGSQRVLDAANRGHSVEAIESAVELCLESGFLPNVDFLFGLPGETPEDMDASLGLAERLARKGARIHGHIFMPLPGTPLRAAPHGKVAERALARLHRLESEGRLYGQWRRQAGLPIPRSA